MRRGLSGTGSDRGEGDVEWAAKVQAAVQALHAQLASAAAERRDVEASAEETTNELLVALATRGALS